MTTIRRIQKAISLRDKWNWPILVCKIVSRNVIMLNAIGEINVERSFDDWKRWLSVDKGSMSAWSVEWRQNQSASIHSTNGNSMAEVVFNVYSISGQKWSAYNLQRFVHAGESIYTLRMCVVCPHFRVRWVEYVSWHQFQVHLRCGAQTVNYWQTSNANKTTKHMSGPCSLNVALTLTPTHPLSLSRVYLQNKIESNRKRIDIDNGTPNRGEKY